MPPEHLCNRKFIGFALCAVIAFEGSYCGRGLYVGCSYQFQSSDNHMDQSIFGLNLSVTGRWPITFIDSDHIVLGYSPVRVLKGDFKTASFKFRPSIYGYKGPVKGCKVKYCGVSPLYTQPNVIQSNFSVEKLAPRMTMVDHIKTRKRHDDYNPEQINTNGSRSGGTDDEELEPNHKRVCKK